MKIMISYPPIDTKKGTPLLSQNRQFQYFHNPTYIYPMVPASAATLLKQNGYEVIWNDCIAQGWDYKKFIEFVEGERPDLIAMETKTPVIKQHWKIINDLKQLSTIDHQLWTVLMGDHVTALPQESMESSKVDFVLTGGDYDFMLLNLCNFLGKQRESKQLSAELEPGVWYRSNGEIKNTGRFQLNHDLDNLPFIDRDLTKWQFYAYENGNYKRTPGSYIMAGRDCWWSKCTFCSWTQMYPEFRVRRVDNVLDEIGHLIESYEVREVMDDTGTFPVGEWLREFCHGMIKRGYHEKIHLDCNMRFGACSLEDYQLMKKAGFRLLLFGLESANQETLDRISKNLKVETIIESCKLASQAGLSPHLTVMFGYPWEGYEEAKRTMELGKFLMKKGYAHTLQSTIVIPYPGTSLFRECEDKSLLKTLDWNRYDMWEPVMKTPLAENKLMEAVRVVYKVAFDPEFIARRLFSIRSLDDLKFFFRAVVKVKGHLLDFAHKS